MSTNELQHFFPSSTHPAIAIASQILSTLRNLTGPGKGNDLKPEERTALVGVAALLACERVQSKDLIESTAQKASHVSPAHFRAALAVSRNILANHTSDVTSNSPRSSSRRTSARNTPSQSTSSTSNLDDNNPNKESQQIQTSALSPFSTPKKKKWSSGVDISGLIKHQHSPAKSSPLKQDTTPRSARTSGRGAEQDGLVTSTEAGPSTRSFRNGKEPASKVTMDINISGDHLDEDPVEDISETERTPTKKSKYTTQTPGVDLISATTTKTATSTARKKKSESTNAFFALRPGSLSTPNDTAGRTQRRERSASPTPTSRYPDANTARKRVRGLINGGKKLRRLEKKDWTFWEDTWGSEEVKQKNQVVLDKVFAELPGWLAARELPVLENVVPRSQSLSESLLSGPIRDDDLMEVDS